MSKKSRKRNKKILAAIGIGLGAAALASRKKGTAADANDGFREKTKSVPTGPKELGISTRKKSTPVKTPTTPTTIQDNKPAKRSNASIAGDFITKVNNPKKMESGMQMSNDLVSSKLPARNNKSIADSLAYNSTFAQNQRRNAPVTGTTQPGMKSGGRAGYRSGGKIKKSMGKALRGGGKVMR